MKDIEARPPSIRVEERIAVGDRLFFAADDGVRLLAHLFLGGPPPAQPFPACGLDTTPDALGRSRSARGPCFEKARRSPPGVRLHP